ncbi:hypothetical protein VN0025_10230 [Helicobacter pylori]
MTIRFDSNNNNSEWMEEIQMLVDKINSGSPFGVIFIADNDKLIEKLRLIERRSNGKHHRSW